MAPTSAAVRIFSRPIDVAFATMKKKIAALGRNSCQLMKIPPSQPLEIPESVMDRKKAQSRSVCTEEIDCTPLENPGQRSGERDPPRIRSGW